MKDKDLRIDGIPIAKNRPRVSRRGSHVSVYSDQVKEEKRIKTILKSQLNDFYEGAVIIECLFVMPRPKSHFGTGRNAGNLKKTAPKVHTKRPDIDNLCKWVCDCLNGIAYKDDAQVISLSGTKIYGENPFTEINIKQFNA